MTLQQRLLSLCALCVFQSLLAAAPPAEPTPAVRLWEQGQDAMRADIKLPEAPRLAESKSPSRPALEIKPLAPAKSSREQANLGERSAEKIPSTPTRVPAIDLADLSFPTGDNSLTKHPLDRVPLPIMLAA